MSDATDPPAVSSRGARVWPPALLAAAVGLALMGLAGLSPRSAADQAAQAGGPVIGVSAETAPRKLPRSHMVPASLRLGFTSEAPGSPTTPELAAIGFEVSRNLAFQTAGLPSCPIAELYSQSANAAQACAGSLVGHGTVISEVTLPGQAPVTIEGRLSAFYDLGEGQDRILAQVTSTGALPLTYVIPFTIHRPSGAFATTLSANHMQLIKGECARGHPNCFSQSYTYEGIYGHISKFELTLDRQFVHAGKRIGVVNADCPARGSSSSATFPLVKVSVAYPLTPSLSQVATGRCEVSAPPHRHRHRRGS